MQFKSYDEVKGKIDSQVRAKRHSELREKWNTPVTGNIQRGFGQQYVNAQAARDIRKNQQERVSVDDNKYFFHRRIR